MRAVNQIKSVRFLGEIYIFLQSPRNKALQYGWRLKIPQTIIKKKKKKKIQDNIDISLHNCATQLLHNLGNFTKIDVSDKKHPTNDSESNSLHIIWP